MHGYFQRKLLTGTLDTIGRAAVVPAPALDMDHVGVPEAAAWDMYEPFIMRRLSRQYNAGVEGPNKVPLTEIARWVKNKDSRAKNAMLQEMQERPVLLNRAPVWHRYGYMAAFPVLTPGESLQVPQITSTGYNLDHDGDTMGFGLPVSDDAVKEAIDKMLPSRNLLSVADFKPHMLPRQEYLIGLYLATQAAKVQSAPRSFATKADALAAYKRGEIKDLHQPVHILQ